MHIEPLGHQGQADHHQERQRQHLDAGVAVNKVADGPGCEQHHGNRTKDGNHHHREVIDQPDRRNHRIKRKHDIQQRNLYHDADHAVARSRRHRGLGLLRRFQAQVYLVGCLGQQEQTTEDQYQIAPGNVLSQHAEPGLDQPDNPGQRE